MIVRGTPLTNGLNWILIEWISTDDQRLFAKSTLEKADGLQVKYHLPTTHPTIDTNQTWTNMDTITINVTFMASMATLIALRVH